MENKIVFKGPYNINKLDKDIEEKLNNPGIYIWGFMVDANYKPLNCKNIFQFIPNKMKFLPYYVGMATGNSDSSILKRLNQHKNVRIGNAAKYMRINKDALDSFYKDNSFPIHFQKDKNYYKKLMIYNLKSEKNAIPYFNNPWFMFFLYKKKLLSKFNDLFKLKNSYNLPITSEIFNDCIKVDPLNDIVNKKANFWFCYAEFNITSNNDFDRKELYENLESLTYFSLKGKTISEVKTWKENNIGFIIQDNTNSAIFKNNPSFEFQGY